MGRRFFGVWFVVEATDEVGAAYLAEGALNGGALLGLIPEEELPLGEFLLLGLGDVEWFKGQRVEAGVVGFGADGHGGGCEVLHLFEVEVELLGFGSQLCHVGQRASGVTADEVGDELVVEMLFATDAVEESFEIVEEPEGRLAHEVEHLFGGVLGSHFQSSAHMSGDELAGVLTGGLVDVGGTCLVK